MQPAYLHAMPVGSPDSTPPKRSGPWLVALAIVGALAAAVLLAGPLTNAIERAFHSEANFAKVFRYLALGLMVAAIAVTLRPWRDVPPDWWGLFPRGGRPHGMAGGLRPQAGDEAASWRAAERTAPLRPVASPDAPGARRNLALIAAGFALIVALIVAVGAIHFAAGQAEWDRSPHAMQKFSRRLWKFLLLAIPFAILEEAFFRGWLLDRCRARVRSTLVAAVIASVVFGFLHAFHKIYAPEVAVGAGAASTSTVGPADALAILRSWGDYVLDVAAFGPKFVGASVFAFALCAARER